MLEVKNPIDKLLYFVEAGIFMIVIANQIQMIRVTHVGLYQIVKMPLKRSTTEVYFGKGQRDGNLMQMI